jgi:hypothetical protein
VDKAGFDISGAKAAIAGVARTLEAARGGDAHRLSPERLGSRLCRGRHAGVAQLAQVQCAQDDAQEDRIAGRIADPWRLGLRDRR